MFTKDMSIAEFDPELKAAIDAETLRQEEHIELIASENYASRMSWTSIISEQNNPLIHEFSWVNFWMS